MMNQMHSQIHQMPGMQLMSRLSSPPQYQQNMNQVGHGNMMSPRPGYPVSSNNNIGIPHQPAKTETNIDPIVSSTPQTMASIDRSSNISILSELSVPAVPQQP